MNRLLLNTAVSAAVAATLVTAMAPEVNPVAHGVSSEPSLLPSARTEHEPEAHGLQELWRTQDKLERRLARLDRSLRAVEKSLQASSSELRERLAQLEHTAADAGSSTEFIAEAGESDTVRATEFEPSIEYRTDTASPLEHITRMDAVFYAQGSDSHWDEEAREQIYDSYVTADVEGLELRDLTCTGAMCRMEILQEPGMELTEASFAGSPLVPWDHRSATSMVENPDGSVSMVTYVSRQGYDLPSFD